MPKQIFNFQKQKGRQQKENWNTNHFYLLIIIYGYHAITIEEMKFFNIAKGLRIIKTVLRWS
jgi:hypothetical protein